MKNGTIELLAPAGDMERLHMAVLYGADSVYLAGTSFGMRSFAGNFSPEELPKAVEFAHAHGVSVHVTVNTMPRNAEAAALPAYLEQLEDAGVDALILADLGAFQMAGKYAPHCARHVSTQQSIGNYACANAWHDLGAQRVVLARELSLDEIAEIRAKTPKSLEIETFGHGAMCVSYSGRCLLSNYMTGRDSNRGACAQPCRYQYALMEEKRPGEYFPVFEDEKGTYILNSRDMCMIDHLDDLQKAGVDCIKSKAGPNPLTMPPSSPGPTGTALIPLRRGSPWTRSGGMRWSTSPTGSIPLAFTTVSPDNTRKIPGTSGSGRSAPSWNPARRRGWPPVPCGTNSPRETPWRPSDRTCGPLPLKWAKCLTPRVRH